MSEYLERFRSCGQNVRVADNVYLEHPEVMEVGDNVTFMSGVYIQDCPRVCRIGSNVTFFPNSFIQGSPDRFVVEDNVGFYPGTYISLGGAAGYLEVGHHSHFAAGCALYSAGGLKIGPYCNIAAHVVLATIGHDPALGDKPMTLTPGKSGPIVLEEDIWIGANATVTQNTRIAQGCVVGANAVVTRDTEPFGVYVGVPARRVRDR